MMVRLAEERDLPAILEIYNQGILDRVATLESDPKDMEYMAKWFADHTGRYCAVVAESDDGVIGWAALNRYSHRCAYDGVGELSVYVNRGWRGKKIGQALLSELESYAKNNGFYKIVLFTFPINALGQGLYRRMGYREVGTFVNQGRLDGRFIDVMAMEKLL